MITKLKEQAARITMQKIIEICNLLPELAEEIDFSRGETQKGRDNVTFKWKNGSSIDILAATDSSRGQRRNCGIIEEAILVDGQALNEIIIPVMNIDRLLPDGTRDPQEHINQGQIYITSAGYKNSFAYQRLIELYVDSLVEPENNIVLAGTYKIPVKEGLLKEDFIQDLKLQGTYSEESFEREFMSSWSGATSDAFYSAEKVEKLRVLNTPEWSATSLSKKDKNFFYILGVDVGRYECTTEVAVFKVYPTDYGSYIKSLVNIYTLDSVHFEEQSIALKKLYYKYKARAIAIDGNGIGSGLLDFLIVSQTDTDTGETFLPFGVINDPEGKYAVKRGVTIEDNALYVIKANNNHLNTVMYSYVKMQLNSGKIKFLIDEGTARLNLLKTKGGMEMTAASRAMELRPFVATTGLKEQMLNLIEKNDGQYITLARINKGIQKDKFSAFSYGLYYIRTIEQEQENTGGFGFSSLSFIN